MRSRRKLNHAIVLAAAFAARPAWAVLAFPGAEGFGANSVGGRGGDVYHVTSLVDDPNHLTPGSLFYGLYSKNVPAAGRTIVFDVGGTIYLNQGTSLDIKDIHNVTIAGQTAPGPGITIIGNTVQVTTSKTVVCDTTGPTHDIIIPHLSLRKGATGAGEDALSIQGTGNTHDIIADHISGSWSQDEVISVTQTATNVTVQNSMMSEALTSDHAYGALIRPTVDSSVSYVHNLFSNQKSRNPRPGTYDAKTLDFEFQNNVIYNWSDRAGYTAGADTNIQHENMNYVGNYLIAGPSTVDNSGNTTRRSTAFYKEVNSSPLDLHFWQENNKIDSTAGATRDGVDTGWGMFKTLTGTTITPFPLADQAAGRFNYPMNAPDSPDVAYSKMLATVGSTPWARGSIDTRLVNDVMNYTGVAPITAPDATEWNSLVNAPMTARPAAFDWDRDADGMPNYWEAIRGTNFLVADNNGTLASNGYTNLENYLNSLTFIANWNLNADGNWSGITNWAGTVPSSNYATANFLPGITAPRTVTVDSPMTVSDMNFDSAISYTVGGTAPITIDALSGFATISLITGNHTIAAPVTLSDDVLVTVVPAASTLAFTGALTATGRTISKAGAGTAQFENIRAAGLSISAGAVKISAKAAANNPAGTSVVNALTLNTGTLDLTNNAAIIDYTSAGTILNDTRLALQAGRLKTSLNTAGHALGYADNSTLGVGTFAGQQVDGTSVLIEYTFGGDANLDGTVNALDFSALAGAFGTGSGKFWTQADFDYNGTVDSSDFTTLSNNFGSTLPAATLGALVPEPSAAAFAILLSSTALLRKRQIFTSPNKRRNF